MTFEKDFPNLMLKERVNTPVSELRFSTWTMERLLEDIQKHCFDKARVKEAIEKYSGGECGLEPIGDAIFKELGLQ